jgi:hypothetical protein
MRGILFFALCLLLGCKQEEDVKTVYDVPEEFQVYIDSFIHEASIRGRSININNLIISYDPTIEAPYCGVCNSSSKDPRVQKVISINPNLQCGYDPLETENFIFHELGHCVLGRLHDGQLLPNGDPRSIMIEGKLDLYSPCIYQIDENPCDNTFKRAYYLDELFDEATTTPDWGD